MWESEERVIEETVNRTVSDTVSVGIYVCIELILVCIYRERERCTVTGKLLKEFME